MTVRDTKTNLTFCAAVFCVLAMVSVLAACEDPAKNKVKEPGTGADLLSLSIGSYKATGITDMGVTGEEWEADSFSPADIETPELKIAPNSMTKPNIKTEASAGAVVKFAFVAAETKPSSFNTEKEFTFTSASYLYVQVTSEDEESQNYYRVRIYASNGDARLKSMKIAKVPVTLGDPIKNLTDTPSTEGSVTIEAYKAASIASPSVLLDKDATATVAYAMSDTPPESSAFSNTISSLTSGKLWVRITPQDKVSILYYIIGVTVDSTDEGYGEPDPSWASDPYNASLRVFPNAPDEGILDYGYFSTNASPQYWNDKGHNHKYPDPFHFANGNKVTGIADWENRQKEISAILQYYMHGRMPSIDPDVLEITFSDTAVGCKIDLKHIESGRTAQFVVNHTAPSGASANKKDKLLLFGVGMPPNAQRHPGWGIATFETAWGGSESTRAGTCATLYGLSNNGGDTPSVNMEYAWAMSVILTVIEEGGLRGYYNPERIGVYGFSRWGKAAMLIGAFAESRGGHKMGFTFVGSAGSGGPAIDRWINQMGYKGHTEDPLPVDAASVPDGGVNNFADLKGIEWYFKKPISDDHGAATASQVVRGWKTTTSGIPVAALIYGEAYDDVKKPGPPETWGRIQVLSQARSETPGWFSARFSSLKAFHDQAKLDIGSGGVVCTMPFDAHYISALIAPRIIYYEDGYNTMRNNPEGQWANWLMTDEVYQMYAEKLNDPSIIWRNAIKMYDIDHAHQVYQDQDEYDLVTALYANQTPNAKFRTPPFPVDDPRYRWDFDRMDWGRPGHPTIAERVQKMRGTAKVKAMDTRGLLDDPEPFE